ncbi:MAG: hypothetical protein ACK4KV_22505 [Rhodocyclaceae bacterium]
MEGIFDAIVLLHAGVAAVCSISCSHYPGKALAALAGQYPERRPRRVFACDGDKAGRLLR